MWEKPQYKIRQEKEVTREARNERKGPRKQVEARRRIEKRAPQQEERIEMGKLRGGGGNPIRK